MQTRTCELPAPPLPNTYWVQPGRLLAGEYPGSHSRADTLHRLKALIDSGVTYFLDLTQPDELSSYERLLKSKGKNGREIVYVRKPVRDHSVPTDLQMREILDYLKDALADGECVYVHCRAGIGRTGTVIACHLIEGGLQPQQALDQLQTLWVACEQSELWPQTPETEEQMEYVLAWQSSPPQKPAVAGQRSIRKPAPSSAAPLQKGMKEIPLRDRYLGALVGLAVGDALGACTQNRKPGEFEPVADMIGGGFFDLPRGAWTDDTAMALCLAESLLECRGNDARDQITRFQRWQREGYLSSTGRCIGITSAVARALAAAQWSGKPYSGSHDPQRLDKEPVTRIAPAVLYFARDPQEAIEQAAQVVRTTHQSPGILDACRYAASLLLAVLSGKNKQEMLAAAQQTLVALAARKEKKPAAVSQAPLIALAAGSFRNKQPPGIHGGGNILDAIEAALWAFDRARDFREGALMVVNLGVDADVAGALYGQLAGAFHGVGAIPAQWRECLAQRRLIEEYAERLLGAAA